MAEELKGQIKRILFRNRKTGYARFFFTTNKKVDILCYGVISNYTEMTPLLLLGHFQEEAIDNRRNNIFFVENSMFYCNNQKYLKDYISHNLCDGMGQAAAEKILDLCKGDIFEFVNSKDAVVKLQEAIRDMTEAKAMTFLTKIRSTEVCRKVYELLYPYGGTYTDAQALFDQFYNNTISMLQQNPYQCARLVNIPFPVIDAFAKNRGFYYYDTNRIKLIAKLAIQKIETTGSVFEEYPFLLRKARQVEMTQGAFESFIPEAILAEEFVKSGYAKVLLEDGGIHFYPRYLFEAETQIAENLMRLKKHSIALIPQAVIDNQIVMDTKLDASQKECYRIFGKTGISIIIGGPGTGKTHTIKELITFLKNQKPQISYALCAPTGRAAERITETSGMTASTIHILLGFKSCMGKDAMPTFNKTNPLAYDLIVVDESSMIDTQLFLQLLDALKEDATLILVGDENQLKSVGPGKVLEDLIRSEQFPVYRLTAIHRQQNGSGSIIENSKRIVNGRTDLITDNAFHILRADSPAQMKEYYKKLFLHYYNPADIYSMQTLGIMKNNECGVCQLNELSQSLTKDTSVAGFYNGKYSYYINDKIMTVKNNYDFGYMNGDIGLLQSYQAGEVIMEVREKEVHVSTENADDLSLAYSITVHKSQGSEADVIIFVIPYDVPDCLLDNSLIYVGATRAKKEVWIISEMDALERGIKNKRPSMRKTGLINRIKERA